MGEIKMALRKVRKADGTVCEMEYVDVCKDLGYIAEVKFIKITTAGTISFYLAKPDEVRPLLSAVKSKGYVPARSLIEAAGK